MLKGIKLHLHTWQGNVDTFVVEDKGHLKTYHEAELVLQNFTLGNNCTWENHGSVTVHQNLDACGTLVDNNTSFITLGSGTKWSRDVEFKGTISSKGSFTGKTVTVLNQFDVDNARVDFLINKGQTTLGSLAGRWTNHKNLIIRQGTLSLTDFDVVAGSNTFLPHVLWQGATLAPRGHVTCQRLDYQHDTGSIRIERNVCFRVEAFSVQRGLNQTNILGRLVTGGLAGEKDIQMGTVAIGSHGVWEFLGVSHPYRYRNLVNEGLMEAHNGSLKLIDPFAFAQIGRVTARGAVTLEATRAGSLGRVFNHAQANFATPKMMITGADWVVDEPITLPFDTEINVDKAWTQEKDVVCQGDLSLTVPEMNPLKRPRRVRCTMSKNFIIAVLILP